MRKKFILALCLAAFMAGTAHAGLAPLSPEFLKWREEQKGSVRVAGEPETARNYGLRPSPLNLAHLASNPVKAAAELPTKFDLRDWNVVPPVRNQTDWGTCWTFATMAAIETNYLMQLTGHAVTKYITAPIDSIGSTPDKVDLSEMHLAWFTLMGPNLEQRLTNSRAKDIRNPTGYSAINEGGWAGVPVTVMSRGWGWGPVTEEAMPYLSRYITSKEINDVVGGQRPGETYEEWNKRHEAEIERRTDPWCSENLTGKKPSDYTSVLRLKDASYVVNMGNGGNEYLGRMFKENRDGIKQLIMEKGALFISYNSGGTVSGDSYYYTGDKDPHAVALIGWDDDYATENFTGGEVPSKPGAWLIRNSWGTEAPGHDKGYFWMSYEQDMGMGTAFTMAAADSTLTTYTHSDLGWCDSWGDGRTNSPFYGASVFKAGTGGGTLKEIGFYTTDNNATVELRVYRYGSAKPAPATLTTGQPVATVPSKTYDYAGYHTVTLDTTVSLNAGEYFAIVQRAANPTYGYPQAVMAKIDNYSDFAQFYDGEGYTSSDGTEWFDGIKAEDNGKSTPITPCLYAFMTGAAANDEGEDTVDVKIDGIDVVDFSSFARDVNVNYTVNETLNPDIPEGRVFALTLGGTNGSAVAEGHDFALYLMYTDDLLKWVDEGTTSEQGVRYPSDTIVPLYPQGYKPDLFVRYSLEDSFGNKLTADLPVYGPFEDTTAAGGKITLDVDGLVYADIGGVDKAGEKAKIPAGYHDLYYWDETDTETSAAGVVEDLKVTAGGSHSHSGCNMGLGGLAALGLALFIKRR